MVARGGAAWRLRQGSGRIRRGFVGCTGDTSARAQTREPARLGAGADRAGGLRRRVGRTRSPALLARGSSTATRRRPAPGALRPGLQRRRRSDGGGRCPDEPGGPPAGTAFVLPSARMDPKRDRRGRDLCIHAPQYEQMFYHPAVPWRRSPSSTATPTSRSSTGPRRSRTWSSGRSSWACGARGDRPPGPLRRGPLRHRRPGGRPAPDRRHGGRAARPGRARPGWGRRAAAQAAAGRSGDRSAPELVALAAGRPMDRRLDGRAVRPASPSSACVRPDIGSRAGRTCAASGRASWARTSCCWRGT